MNELVAVTDEIRVERYAGAEVIFLAGSLIRGDGTAASDLDLVVVFSRLPHAFRESFRFGRWPVEAFVHDPETMTYFFLEHDKPSGVPTLLSMVAEGIEVPEANSLSRSLKQFAASLLSEGPPPWGQEEVDRSRYTITCLVDDLRDPRSFAESAASGAALYESLATHYFRSRGFWSAKNKTIPRKLGAADAGLAAGFDSSFSELFRKGNPKKVIELAEHVLGPSGGWLFEGYTAHAAEEWRLSGPKAR